MRAETRRAVFLISDVLGLGAGVADRIVVMYAGRVVESADAADILGRAVHPYTAELLKCVPDLRKPRLERMPSLAGHAPSAGGPEAGCAFAPRCPLVGERCRSERPVLRDIGGAGHQAACHHPLPA
jgi:oligopeptide/dipeptide ABC transporter ATP-binding protein